MYTQIHMIHFIIMKNMVDKAVSYIMSMIQLCHLRWIHLEDMQNNININIMHLKSLIQEHGIIMNMYMMTLI